MVPFNTQSVYNPSKAIRLLANPTNGVEFLDFMAKILTVRSSFFPRIVLVVVTSISIDLKYDIAVWK